MSEQVDAVQRMQDFIEENLEQEIGLNDLADVSGYSPWHSYRLFQQFTRFTVSDYIRRLRLSRSALKLRDGDTKVIDVAFELGFGSVDGYQRAFFREFGCNPKEYARNPVPIYLFVPYGVKYQRTKKEKSMERAKNVFIQVITKPQRKVIVKRGIKAEHYMTYCEEVGCDVWGLLLSMDPEPVSLWLPKKYVKEGTSVYVQGVEKPMDYDGPVPEGFDVIVMPEAKFLMFQGEPFAEEDYEEAIESIWNAMATYNPSTIGYQWDEDNPRIQLEPRGERGYIELKAIKSL